MAGNDVVDARICPQCKREFVVPLGGREDYVYKLHQKTRTDYFCSWTCYKMAKRKTLHSKSKLTQDEQNWLKWAAGK